jgi:hypothetical protein
MFVAFPGTDPPLEFMIIPVLCQGVPQNITMRNGTIRSSLLDIFQVSISSYNDVYPHSRQLLESGDGYFS